MYVYIKKDKQNIIYKKNSDHMYWKKVLKREAIRKRIKNTCMQYTLNIKSQVGQN